MRLFLIIGSIIATALIIAVSYLLFFANPVAESNDQFSDLNFGDTTDEGVVIVPADTADTLEETNDPVLIQISENPVLGFAEVSATNSSSVLYVEGGTGHVFSYDILSGAATRISNITIQNPREAVVSADGSYAVVAAGEFVTDELVIVTLSQGTSSTNSIFRLNARASNIDITSDNVLLYTTTANGNTTGNRFDLGSKASLGTVFTVPFTETIVNWSDDISEGHLLHNKPEWRLKGNLYKYTDSGLDRLPVSNYGLSAIGNGQVALFSDFDNDQSGILYRRTNNISLLSEPLLPEKCTLGSINTDIAICATSDGFMRPENYTQWRKGIIGSEDELLLLETGSLAVSVIPLKEYTNLRFDIDQLYYGENILLRNRTDNSLWYVDLDSYFGII